jgi:hypothetical protein
MYNKPLNYQTHAKYLGVTFDEKLMFKQHIADKFCKTKRMLFAAKNAMGKIWGPNPTMTKWLYTNIIRPTFTYGLVAWAKNTRTKDFHNKAKKLQRLALCNIGPIRKSSPTTALEIYTHTVPLELYIKGEFLKASMRTIPYIEDIPVTNDTMISHIAWANKLSSEAGIKNIPTDIIPPFTQNYKSWQHCLEQYDIYNESRTYKLQIFTDGSRIKKGDGTSRTGCGYIIYYYDSQTQKYQPYHETAVYLGTITTIFQAEVFAIGHATAYIFNKHIHKHGN